MEKYQFSSILPLAQFLKVVNQENLEFMKGKGRQFTSTAVGTVFMAEKFDKKKPAYIAFGGPDLKTKSGDSLAGTFWLVNSVVTKGDTISAEV